MTRVSSPQPDGAYITGQTIEIDITFDAPVFVTGVPTLALNSGGTANYSSGTGTNTLKFTYTVGSSDSTLRLDVASSTALKFMNFGGPVMALMLNGGPMRDSSGNDAILLVPVSPAAGALGTNDMIAINPPYVPVTIDATQSGMSFTVNGTGCASGSYSTPATLNWTTTSTCTVQFSNPQSPSTGTQYVFTGWTDGGVTSNPRSISTPASATTYTATFKTQYQLTTAAAPGGTGSVSGAGYYDSGSSAPVVATPNQGYQFANWTGPVVSSTNASTSVAMNAPASVTANFELVTTTTVVGVSGHYGDTVTLSATVGPPNAVFAGSLQFQIAGNNVGAPVSVNGSGTYTISYTIDGGAGNYTIGATLTSNSSTVAGSSGTGTLAVTAAVTTINWPTPAGITYGTPLSGAQLNATVTAANRQPAGNLVYSPIAGMLLAAGNQTLSVSFTPADPTRFSAASATVAITITKANASVTPNPAGKVYGQPDPNPLTTGVLAGFLAADNVAATYSRTTGEAPGNYTISATLTPSAVLSNYNITYNTAAFTIQSATPGLPPPQTGNTTYGVMTTLSVTINAVNGGAVPTGSVTFQFTDKNNMVEYICASGAVQTQPCSVPLDANGKASLTTTNIPAGSDNITATYSGDPNYSGGEQTSLNFSVMQANTQTGLTISPNSPTPVYGTLLTIAAQVSDASPSSSGVPTGTVQFAYSLDNGNTWSNLGNPANLDATGKAQIQTTTLPVSNPLVRASYSGDSNFVASTVNVAQAVTPKTLTVSGITAQDKPYNGNTMATVNSSGATLSGVINSDNVSLTGTATGTFTDPNAGNNKPVTVNGLSLGGPAASNYSLAPISTTASITKLDASVTPAPASKAYGTPDPPLTGVLSGFLASDNVSAAYTRTSGEAVGNYTISAVLSPAAALNNYNIAYHTATFTIQKATPAVTWVTPAAIVYGTALSATQLNASSSVPGSFTYTPPAGTVLPVGNNQALSATFSPTDATDYNPVTLAVMITVSKAPLTVSADNLTKAYGAPVPPLTASYNGFVNGENSSVLTGTPTLSTTATASSAPGTYPITIAPGTLAAANYSFTFVSGTLTITQTATPSVYVTNAGSASVSVINPVTNTVSSTIHVGQIPANVVFSPDATKAYVTNTGSGSVSVLNTATGALFATVNVGIATVHAAITPDGSKLYVANGIGNSVSVIDTSTNKVVATVAVGANPIKVAVSSDGTRVYSTNAGTHTVSVLNVATNTVVATVNVGQDPVDIALFHNTAYVVNTRSQNVSMIDTSTNTVSGTISVGLAPIDIALSADGSRAYVANAGSNSVSVINTSTKTVIATVATGAIPSHLALSPDGTQVYVTNALAGTVSVIKTSTGTVAGTVHVGLGPAYVDVSADGTTAYVTNTLSNSVSVIKTSTNTVVATIPVGSNPVNLAVH